MHLPRCHLHLIPSSPFRGRCGILGLHFRLEVAICLCILRTLLEIQAPAIPSCYPLSSERAVSDLPSQQPSSGHPCSSESCLCCLRSNLRMEKAFLGPGHAPLVHQVLLRMFGPEASYLRLPFHNCRWQTESNRSVIHLENSVLTCWKSIMSMAWIPSYRKHYYSFLMATAVDMFIAEH